MNARLRLLKTLTVFCLSFSIVACGFHLRESYNFPEEIDTLSLTSYDPYSDLAREMKNRLRLYDIHLTAPAANISNLNLIGESYGESTLSLFQNATVAQRQFSYTVRYAVSIPNKGNYNFSADLSRSFLDNPLSALAKSVEQELLAQEMRVEATKQIMRQLSQLTADIEAFDKLQAEEKALAERYKNAQGEEIGVEIQFEGKDDKAKPLSSYMPSER